MRISIGNCEYDSILLISLNTHCWPLICNRNATNKVCQYFDQHYLNLALQKNDYVSWQILIISIKSSSLEIYLKIHNKCSKIHSNSTNSAKNFKKTDIFDIIRNGN